jgi:nitrogen fixation protein FixH
MRVEGERRSAWIPWALGAAFGAFLASGVALSVIAARSDPGLVAGAPQRLAGAYVVPTAPAPVLDLRVAREATGGLLVEARLRGPDGRPAAAEAVEGTLQRATHARSDRPLRFAPAADGAWRAVVALPGAGSWEVAVRARGAGGTAQASLRL